MPNTFSPGETMEKYAIILNPNAGRGKAAKMENELLKMVSASIGSYDLFKTEYPNHAREIAASLKNDYSVIVAVGGDGTVHETVNGMMGGKAALAAIPLGSGNDFIKMLNLPKNLTGILEVIRRNKRKKVDIGKVGEQYFPNGVGIGFDALVTKESKEVKKLRGFLIYLYAVLKTIFAYRNEMITLSVNGKTEQREIFLIAVGNGKAEGGGFFLTPAAEFDDGLLDVCIIRALNKMEIFKYLPKALNGKHVHLEQVEMLRTKQLQILSENGITAHADGEMLGFDLKRIDISLIPLALEVIYNDQIITPKG
jgi:YegS/Rv2252/BmrU family lipid kinase